MRLLLNLKFALTFVVALSLSMRILAGSGDICQAHLNRIAEATEKRINTAREAVASADKNPVHTLLEKQIRVLSQKKYPESSFGIARWEWALHLVAKIHKEKGAPPSDKSLVDQKQVDKKQDLRADTMEVLTKLATEQNLHPYLRALAAHVLNSLNNNEPYEPPTWDTLKEYIAPVSREPLIQAIRRIENERVKTALSELMNGDSQARARARVLIDAHIATLDSRIQGMGANTQERDRLSTHVATLKRLVRQISDLRILEEMELAHHRSVVSSTDDNTKPSNSVPIGIFDGDPALTGH